LLDILDDVASDLSAFHRVNDLTKLDSYALFRLAVRLPAYQGVLAARFAAREAEGGQGARTVSTPGQAPGEPIQGTAANLRSVPELKGLFSVTEV